MDKDKIMGAGKQLIGRAKDVPGRLFGDAKLQIDGKAEQAVDAARNAVGSVKEAFRK